MIKVWLQKYQRFILPVLIVLIGLVVAINNYEPGTYLSGWDTLHPEFNYRLYLERVIFGAWQEHQGLGAPASQAHAAELPHVLVLMLLDVFLPTNAVRYAFFFLMYILGGLGVYWFLIKTWFNDKKQQYHLWAAFLGSLLYMFNLGTLQHFYVPLEMFAVHYATIGFVLWSTYFAIKTGKAKYLFWYAIVQILSAPAAHTATLFYMYMFVVFIYAVTLSFTLNWKNKVLAAKRVLLLGLITGLVHFYWMAPNLYYILNHSDYVSEAKISRHFSTEAFWQNQAFGSIKDILILKNFLFNWQDYSFENGSFQELFDEWNNHLNKDLGYPLLYVIAFIYLAGIGIATIKKRKHHLSFLLILLVPFFFLNNLNFPSQFIFGALQNFSDTFNEALRFPFTKFSILFIFAISVYFAHFFGWLFKFFQNLPDKAEGFKFYLASIVAGIFLVLYPSLPALQGNLVSDSMKVYYPNEYFELFSWFEEQPREGRIAKLPVGNFWGWTYHDWSLLNTPQGYQGAGFIWFGLPQPILDREFDRWAETNEFFYHEIAKAVKTEDPHLFNQVLDKYQVKWLFNDKSNVFPTESWGGHYQESLMNLLNDNQGIVSAAKFGQLEIYEYLPVENSWIDSTPITWIDAKSERVRADTIFAEHKDYGQSAQSAVRYPLYQLLSEKNSVLNFEENQISAKIQSGSSNTLQIPEWRSFSRSLPVEIYSEFSDENTLQLKVKSLLPTLRINNNMINLNSMADYEEKTLIINIAEPADNYILALNDTYIIFPPTSEELYLGSFSLPFEPSEIMIYSNSVLEEFSFLTREIHTSDCSTGHPNSDAITTTLVSGGINISADNVVACSTDVVAKQLTQPGLMKLEFTYSSRTSPTNTRVCIYSPNSQGCINDDFNYILTATSLDRNATIYEPMNIVGEFNISFNLDSTGTQKQLAYKNVKAEIHPVVASIKVDENIISELAPKATSLEIQKNSEIELSYPFGQNNELLFTHNLKTLGVVTNCGQQDKEMSVKIENESHFFFAKDGGAACEFFHFSQTIPQQEYLLATETEHIKGRELQLTVNDSAANYVENIYLSSDPQITFYSIPDYRKDSNLSVNFQNFSYGNYPAQNRLIKLAMAPFPLTWSANIALISNEGASPLAEVEILEKKRHANFFYKADINNQNQREGSLLLKQTYDPTWVAISSKNFVSPLKQFKANGWMNGWIVNQGQQTIYMVYLPQFYVFIGYLVALGSILYLIKRKYKENLKGTKGLDKKIVSKFLGD